MKNPPYPQTPQSSRAWFNTYGVCISDWCRCHNISRDIVNDLFSGELKGYRGEAHRAAILLGLKPDPTKAVDRRAA